VVSGPVTSRQGDRGGGNGAMQYDDDVDMEYARQQGRTVAKHGVSCLLRRHTSHASYPTNTSVTAMGEGEMPKI